jgi:hypothetical protein
MDARFLIFAIRDDRKNLAWRNMLHRSEAEDGRQPPAGCQ